MNGNDSLKWRSGEKNLITDVPGLKVGCAKDEHIKTGVTVLTADDPFVASVDVMGGAPGTRETDCLQPDKLVQQVDALVLSGGSAFGLDSASGVMEALREEGRGLAVGPVQVPIVPAAIVFDLINGGASDWKENPYKTLGKRAYRDAQKNFKLGNEGAGTGATTANLKGGMGSASIALPNGVTVGALVIANPHGSVVLPGSKSFWAAPFEINDEFGGLGIDMPKDPYAMPENQKLKAFEALQSKRGENSDEGPGNASETTSPAGMNTTIAIVATDAQLDKAQLKRLAVSAQDGMARAIVPSHTPFDGDLVFSVSTGNKKLQEDTLESMQLGHAAAVCLSRAIARGVYHATVAERDTLPVWSSLG